MTATMSHDVDDSLARRRRGLESHWQDSSSRTTQATPLRSINEAIAIFGNNPLPQSRITCPFHPRFLLFRLLQRRPAQLDQMSTDISTLRAQLKAFEREFKARHHHPPSVDDIKNAGFADKYKLYKKLFKLGNATRSLPENSLVPPCTPPRSVTPKSEIPISIIPRSRAVKTETASASNPFSPSKNKQKQVAPFSFSGSDGSTNLFATPQKANHSLISSHKSLSPDPFPPIQTLPDATYPPCTSAPNNTVSRARKRLRGEPVSPSPVKEKRQRVLPDVLPFAKLSTLSAAEDSDDDDRAAAELAESSFVADSPMKPLPKGGAFKLLFEGGAGDVLSKDGRARSQGMPVNTGLKPSRSKSQRARSMSRSSASETLSDNHQNPKMKASEGKSNKESAKSLTTKLLYPNGFGKNNIFGAGQPSEASLSGPEQAIQVDHIEESSSQRITAAKRSLTRTDSDALDTLCPNHCPPLLPPSPPPAVSSSVYTGKGKGRGNVTGPIRKRPKLPEDSGDEDEGSTDLHVKIREWSWQQRRDTSRATDTSVEDLDPVFGLGAYDRPSSPGPASEGDVLGDFEVNLPDDLRRLLAISPSKAHTTRDVSMVRGVLYGGRTSSYDAQRGGDIWDVGEIGGASDSQAEDDWEGEPVPWETGDL
ncbi:hypothetical protein BJV74DRAFT_484913 [Russula compacta]|nr:hypothetical protein BJV74DRAFT_484913 [Russula compacta]